MTLIAAWPLKRSIIARLAAHAAGTNPPPPGAELLATGDPAYSAVQVGTMLPAEPDRLCVFGAPLRLSRSEMTAEVNRQGGGLVDETVIVEIRVRVFQPGEDVDGVDRMLGDLVQAVAVAVLNGAPFIGQGRIGLSSITQDPTAYVPNPEPSLTAYASMIFSADVVVN